MFDALCLSYWYVWQGVSWHVLACLSMHRRCCNNFWSCFRRSTDMFDFCFCDMFVRSYPDMFWHVWACTVAVAITFDLASGGLLTCLISVSLICLSGRILTCFDMFEHVWHVLTLVVCQVLFSWRGRTRWCVRNGKKELCGGNPHLTTFTQHVMVGITRSKVIFF